MVSAMQLETVSGEMEELELEAHHILLNDWLEHRTPDRKAWVRCPMPPTSLRVHTDPMPKLWRWRSVVSPSTANLSNLSHRLWQHSFLPFGNFTELNRTVTCMMLKAKANDRRTSRQLPR
ncbi:hypothetical protein TNCV_2139281 [Trichonephila clavipes]|uniref:Uncharacterized protein n=1 Tax=Trichonephila clavipes TaxID=2585209 RepID=A0A8X6S1X4_TRICX|nr:hypothetical protein TNCV_2139281 [Trichonephila clavipes]